MTRTEQIKEELIYDLITWIEEAFGLTMTDIQRKVLRLLIEKDTKFLQTISEARMKHE